MIGKYGAHQLEKLLAKIRNLSPYWIVYTACIVPCVLFYICPVISQAYLEYLLLKFVRQHLFLLVGIHIVVGVYF